MLTHGGNTCQIIPHRSFLTLAPSGWQLKVRGRGRLRMVLVYLPKSSIISLSFLRARYIMKKARTGRTGARTDTP